MLNPVFQFKRITFVIAELAPTNSTGLRDLVYFAPWPELCAIKRFSGYWLFHSIGIRQSIESENYQFFIYQTF